MTRAQRERFHALALNAAAAFASAPMLLDGTFVMQGYQIELKRLEEFVDSLMDESPDPYYITRCATCSGIDAAWSADAPDIHEILCAWEDVGRAYDYVTVAPRLSCTCPRANETAEETK